MLRRPPSSTRTDTLLPYTTLFRSASQYATSVVDHAAWVAFHLDATVEVLHVIQRKDAVAARHDLSGAVGLGAKSGLMEELTRIDEAEGDRKSTRLNSSH